MVNNEHISVQVADGTTGIYVVDPNAVVKDNVVSPRYVDQGELMIYVELKAFMNPKTRFLDRGDKSSEVITITKGIFYSSANANADAQNKKKTFTTDWTEMFDAKKPYDVEGFGVNSIDIEFNASLVPKIHIEFIDVRGKNLLERGDSPDNPYNVFYTFPYPLFELVVKGYFGKAIRMPMIMEKAITRFDPSTGSYLISADFKSWTFAVLNDLILMYALITPYMFPYSNSVGQTKYLGQDLIDKKLTDFYARQDPPTSSKNKNITLKELFTLNSRVAKIVKTELGESAVLRKASVDTLLQAWSEYRDVLNGTATSTGLVGSKDMVTLKYFNDRAKSVMINEQSKLVAQKYLEADQWDIAKALDIEKYQEKDPTNSSNITVLGMTTETFQSISEPVNKFNIDRIQKDAESLRAAITQAIHFYPSIENVVRLVVVHLDVFMELLMDKTSEFVTDDGRGLLLTDAFTKDFEAIENAGKMYRLPWPEYYTKKTNQIVGGGVNPPTLLSSGEEFIKEYPGNSPTENIRNWGEVKFVDAMYDALKKYTMEMNLAVEGKDVLSEIFIASPLNVPVDTRLYNIENNTNDGIMNNMIAQILLMLYHNGILYKTTNEKSRIDNNGIYSYFVTNIVNNIFTPDKQPKNLFQMVGLLQGTVSQLITIDGFRSYMNKNGADINEIIGRAFEGKTTVADKYGNTTRIDNWVSPHSYYVPDKWFPPKTGTSFNETYLKTEVDPHTTVPYHMAPNGVKFNPKALSALHLCAFNTATSLTTEEFGASTTALIFTNEFDTDDMFITRKYSS